MYRHQRKSDLFLDSDFYTKCHWKLQVTKPGLSVCAVVRTFTNRILTMSTLVVIVTVQVASMSCGEGGHNQLR